jgi:hypothetical protein
MQITLMIGEAGYPATSYASSNLHVLASRTSSICEITSMRKQLHALSFFYRLLVEEISNVKFSVDYILRKIPPPKKMGY